MARKIKIPHTYAIVFLIEAIVGVLAWIIPGGTFERKVICVNGIDRKVVKSDSFHYIGNSRPRHGRYFQPFSMGLLTKPTLSYLSY